MPQLHVVKQGECLFSVAHHYGFADWKTIYRAPDNADFRRQRPNPNVIYAGDHVVIPDKMPKAADCSTGRNHTFRVKSATLMLRICVKDEDEEPIAGKEFVLLVDNERFEGKTTDDGYVFQPVNPRAQHADLTVLMTDDEDGERFHYNVRIGHLDPVDAVEGVQARSITSGFTAAKTTASRGLTPSRRSRGFRGRTGSR